MQAEFRTDPARVKNLGIAKSPHFTGALCYDSPHELHSGWFYVHLLEDVSPMRLTLALPIRLGRVVAKPGINLPLGGKLALLDTGRIRNLFAEANGDIDKYTSGLYLIDEC